MPNDCVQQMAGSPPPPQRPGSEGRKRSATKPGCSITCCRPYHGLERGFWCRLLAK